MGWWQGERVYLESWYTLAEQPWAGGVPGLLYPPPCKRKLDADSGRSSHQLSRSSLSVQVQAMPRRRGSRRAGLGAYSRVVECFLAKC